MNVQQLEQLLREFIGSIQQVMQSGEELSDEFQGQVAQVLSALSNKISQEKEKQAEIQEVEAEQAEVVQEVSPSEPISPTGKPPIGGEVPPLEPAPYESSNINAFRYDPKNQQLYVKFQGKYPSQDGPEYSYQDVPPYIFDVFRRGSIAPKTSGKNAWHRWKEGVAPSHGASMYALIKQGGFPYQRVS